MYIISLEDTLQETPLDPFSVSLSFSPLISLCPNSLTPLYGVSKGSIPSIKTPITFQVCWKEPFIIGFWTFWTFLRFYIFSPFFAAAKGSFWQNVGYLSAFGLYEPFPNFSSFLGSYE